MVPTLPPRFAMLQKRNSSATTPTQLKPQNRGTGTRSRRSRGHLARASWGRARQLEPLTTPQQPSNSCRLPSRGPDSRIERKAKYLALILACAHTLTKVLDGSAFQFKREALVPQNENKQKAAVGSNAVKGSMGKKLPTQKHSSKNCYCIGGSRKTKLSIHDTLRQTPFY